MSDEQQYSGETLERWALLFSTASSFVGGGVGHVTTSVGGSMLEASFAAVGVIALLWIVAGAIDSAHEIINND